MLGKDIVGVLSPCRKRIAVALISAASGFRITKRTPPKRKLLHIDWALIPLMVKVVCLRGFIGNYNHMVMINLASLSVVYEERYHCLWTESMSIKN